MSCTHTIFFYHECGHLTNIHTHSPPCSSFSRGVAYLLSAVMNPTAPPATPCAQTFEEYLYVRFISCPQCESGAPPSQPSGLILFELRHEYTLLVLTQELSNSFKEDQESAFLATLDVLEPEHGLVPLPLELLAIEDVSFILIYLEQRVSAALGIEDGDAPEQWGGHFARVQARNLRAWKLIRILQTSYDEAGPAYRYYNPLYQARTGLLAAIERNRKLQWEAQGVLEDTGFDVAESEWEEGEECAICCDGDDKDAEVARLPCGHKFHLFCIAPWLQEQETCPFCFRRVHDNLLRDEEDEFFFR